MASFFSAAYTTGKVVYVNLQQKHSTGLVDLWWKNTATQDWLPAASSSTNDKKITLAETPVAGIYSTAHAALGSYTGEAMVYFFDSIVAESLGAETVYLINGEVTNPTQDLATLRLEINDGGRVDTLLDQAAAGGTVNTISPNVVSPARTWVLTQHADAVTAKNIVTVAAGAIVTLSFDYGRILNLPESSIVAVTAVSDNLDVLTIGSLAPSQSRKCAHFNVTAGLAAGLKHVITCTVTTTDGQTLPAYGNLVVV